MYEKMFESGMHSGFNPFGFMFGGFIFLVVIGIIVSYVYFALVMQTIAKKLKHPRPWLAWVPIANIALVLELGGFHWAWTFLVLIPFLGFIAILVLSTISFWRIFERRNYPGWLALIQWGGFIPFVGYIFTVAHGVILGLVAWQNRK
jgi:hypothetical protein